MFFTKNLQQMFPYLAAKRSGISNWWQVCVIVRVDATFHLKTKNHVISSFNLFWIAFQVVYVVCAIGGGACSAASSNSFGVAKGVPVYMGLLGGIVMLWGARFAAGCTRYVVLERQYVLQKILYHITCVNFTRGGEGGGVQGIFCVPGFGGLKAYSR